MPKLTGRMLQIAAGASGLPLEKVHTYRELFLQAGFELPPLAPDAVTAPPPVGVPAPRRGRDCGGCGKAGDRLRLNGYGPGSQLIRTYSEAGVPHCDACHRLAVQMDRWGVAECRDRIEEIVENILPRAKRWIAQNRPWIHRLLSGVRAEDAALRYRIREDVLAAIERARIVQPDTGRSGNPT